MSKYCENHGGLRGYTRLKETCQICKEWADPTLRHAAVEKAVGARYLMIDETGTVASLKASIDKANAATYPTRKVADGPPEEPLSDFPITRKLRQALINGSVMSDALGKLGHDSISRLYRMGPESIAEAIARGLAKKQP